MLHQGDLICDPLHLAQHRRILHVRLHFDLQKLTAPELLIEKVLGPIRRAPSGKEGALVHAVVHLTHEGTANQSDDQQQAPKREVRLMDADTLKQKDAWRQGLLLFTGDSLEEVVAEIGRYTPVAIEIIDPALKKIRIGGQFRVGDLSGMFEVLETNFGLSITRLDNNRIQISAAEKGQAIKMQEK